jgi:hypothetical protein
MHEEDHTVLQIEGAEGGRRQNPFAHIELRELPLH